MSGYIQILIYRATIGNLTPSTVCEANMRETALNCVPGTENRKGSELSATVLLVGFDEQDQDFLRQLFHSTECPLTPTCRWTVENQPTVPATLMALRGGSIPVVLCDHDRAPGVWQHLLAGFGSLSQPPCLIVTSRLADEYLWEEALNLGAYDVLARPFNRSEVMRSVGLARIHSQDMRA